MTQKLRISAQTSGISTILAALLLVVIVVVLGGIVYTFSSGLVTSYEAQAPTPSAVREDASLDTYMIVTSGNNATLFFRNDGGGTMSIKTEYLKDDSSGVVAQRQLSSPIAIGAGSVANVVIKPSQFTPNTIVFASGGKEYTVTLVTSSGNQFTYDIHT